MVNTIAMNIDIREYLRINPISAHPLTLSQDENDCFLYFNQGKTTYGDGNTYAVYTQRQVFNGMLKNAFGDLVSEDSSENIRFRCEVDSDGKIRWEDGVHLKDSQFKDYVRKDKWERFKSNFELKVAELETNIDKALYELTNEKSRLNYSGAVELQSQLVD